jgi:hypothetical protein
MYTNLQVSNMAKIYTNSPKTLSALIDEASYNAFYIKLKSLKGHELLSLLFTTHRFSKIAPHEKQSVEFYIKTDLIPPPINGYIAVPTFEPLEDGTELVGYIAIAESLLGLI